VAVLYTFVPLISFFSDHKFVQEIITQEEISVSAVTQAKTITSSFTETVTGKYALELNADNLSDDNYIMETEYILNTFANSACAKRNWMDWIDVSIEVKGSKHIKRQLEVSCRELLVQEI